MGVKWEIAITFDCQEILTKIITYSSDCSYNLRKHSFPLKILSKLLKLEGVMSIYVTSGGTKLTAEFSQQLVEKLSNKRLVAN